MVIEQGCNRQKELSNCTFVKTILMLIVVLYHCMLYWGGSWFIGEPVYAAKPLGVLAAWLDTFHIYGFTLVSGYLFYALKYEKGKYSKFLSFAINKCKRLLIPYAFASLIWVIPFAVYFFKYDAGDIIWKYVFGTSPSQLWFLLMLFGVFMIFYPLSNFFEKHHLGGAVIVLLIYGVGIFGGMVLPNVFQAFRACTYIPLFWLGFKLRQHGNCRLRKVPTYLWIVADILLFALARYLSGYNGFIFSLLRLGLDFVLHIVGALMAFFVLQKIAGLIRCDERKTLKFLGTHSMTVYLFHQQVVYVLIHLLNGAVNPYIHSGINFIGAMLISLLLSMLFMKFKFTRMLIGHK